MTEIPVLSIIGLLAGWSDKGLHSLLASKLLHYIMEADGKLPDFAKKGMFIQRSSTEYPVSRINTIDFLKAFDDPTFPKDEESFEKFQKLFGIITETCGWFEKYSLGFLGQEDFRRELGLGPKPILLKYIKRPVIKLLQCPIDKDPILPQGYKFLEKDEGWLLKLMDPRLKRSLHTNIVLYSLLFSSPRNHECLVPCIKIYS